MTVSLLAHTSACLGVVTSAAPGTLTFDPTTSADYLVATVGWSSSSPLTPPSVRFGSQIMQIVSVPIEVDNGFGAVAVYTLPVSAATSQTVTVSSTPNFAGLTSIVICSYSGTSQQLGVIITDEYGTNPVPVSSGTTVINDVSADSAFNYTACTFFGSTPSAVTASTGWTGIEGGFTGNQSVWSFDYTGGSIPSSITLTPAIVQFNTLNIGYEVLVSGTPKPKSSVNITASQISYLGQIGLNPTSATFDANGAEVLVICAARTNNFATPASYTFAGLPLTFLASMPSLNDSSVGGSMDIAVLANPPAGSQTLVGEGPIGYFGDTVVMMVGLSNLSGVAGIKTTYSGEGDSASVNVPPCDQDGSLVLAFVSSPFTFNAEVPNYGWQTVQTNTGAFVDTYILSNIGNTSALPLYLTNSGFAKTQALVLELEKALSVTPDEVGLTSAAVFPFTISGTSNFIPKLTPNGQVFHIYWDSWLDQPLKDANDMAPDDFYLSRIPSYVAAVCLSFAVPQCTYVDTKSNIKTTVGLNFPGSVTLLAQTIALLKSRNPTIKVYVAVQQNTPEVAYPDPYMTAYPGWGGMTPTHVANLKQFITDIDGDGVIIDYECLSTNAAPSFHCTYDENNIPTCFTDTEYVSVIKLMRAGLPRPLTIIIDCLSVGAYVGDYFPAGLPVGYNSGYGYCVSQDAMALADIDGIHIESYDAGASFDPRISLRAFLELFPTTPIYLGLRVGPLQFEDVKQTYTDFLDYCNTAIMLNAAGVHMYSMLWDAIPLPGLNNPLASGAPFGNYGPDFPNANICAAVVAEQFDLPEGDKPLVSKPLTDAIRGLGLGI